MLIVWIFNCYYRSPVSIKRHFILLRSRLLTFHGQCNNAQVEELSTRLPTRGPTINIEQFLAWQHAKGPQQIAMKNITKNSVLTSLSKDTWVHNKKERVTHSTQVTDPVCGLWFGTPSILLFSVLSWRREEETKKNWPVFICTQYHNTGASVVSLWLGCEGLVHRLDYKL